MLKMFFRIKENFSKQVLIIDCLLVVMSIIIVSQNDAFVFNPFILVLLTIGYVISFSTLISESIIITIVGFIINKTYGIELLFLSLIFIIFYLVSFLINIKRINIYIPCFLSNLSIFLIYLFSSKIEFYAINSLVLFFISGLVSIIFINVIESIKRKDEIDDIQFGVFISFALTSFYKIKYINFLLIVFVLILLLKLNYKKLYFITSFSTLMMYGILSSYSVLLLNMLFISLFIVGVINTKFSYVLYIPIASLFLFSYNYSFYLDPIFYQIIIGYLLALFIPKEFDKKISYFLDMSFNDNLRKLVSHQNNKLEQISQLCTLLMDNRFDNFEDIEEQLEKVIKKEVCSKCSNHQECTININRYLNGRLTTNNKKEIVEKCIYPYQLTKTIDNSNKRIVDYSQRELKSVESKKIMNNTYQIIKRYIELSPKREQKKNNFYIEYEKITKEANMSPNGDSCEIYNDEYQTKVMLSDGMGHTSKSRDISEYLLNLLNYLQQISQDSSNSIEACNQILIAKTYEEVYATLDLCDFDLENGKCFIYKAGSYPTYLIRNKTVKEITTKLPPIGIINNIKLEPEVFDLYPNDILLFMTDGFKENTLEIIEKTIQKSMFLPIKNYTKFLFKKLNENIVIDDDQTLIGIKIHKS